MPWKRDEEGIVGKGGNGVGKKKRRTIWWELQLFYTTKEREEKKTLIISLKVINLAVGSMFPFSVTTMWSKLRAVICYDVNK